VQICWDGGDLVCCDQCPCSYHPDCLGISLQELEEAVRWKCPLHWCAECGKGSAQAGNMLFR
jgi:SWI/SNF-related matrix-associated actin-dependent regulator of chromatin subfamily A member 5